MTIPVEAYTTGGRISGLVARSGRLRDVLESVSTIVVERCRWLDQPGVPAGEESFEVDDLLVVVVPDDALPPVHATWHPIRLEVGPYELDGDLPTQPGFDPGRALTRPTGTYVLLRDVRVRILGTPTGLGLEHAFALVNRYGVDHVAADIMLGFFFPGAIAEGVGSAGLAAAPTTIRGVAPVA